jgi:hypothetical protein
MPLLPADVQILPSTSTHIHLCSNSQEATDWLSAELRDRHTKIPNLELQQDGSRGCSAAKFLSTFLFVSQARNCRGGTNISYSVVPKKKEDLDGVPQASSFSYADGLGDKSSFITTELHQLPVYGEQ